MSEEKMMILRMLEQGKITSNEAAELLSALNDKSSKKTKQKTSPKNSNWEKNMEDKVDQLSKNVDSFSKDFSKKVEALSKDFEPKLQKVAQTLLEKTTSFADKISKSLSDSNSFSSIHGKEKNLELHVRNKDSVQLRLTGKNGMVYIKGYNGDKISAKITYIPKEENELIELVEVGNTFYLNYDEAYFNKVSVEAYVPETLFKKLYIETNNNKVFLDNFKSEEIDIVSSKGRIDIKNVSARRLKAETSNAVIEAYQCDVKDLKLITSNADILLNPGTKELSEASIYEWNAETSNGPIKVNTSIDSRVGYDLKATTSLNGVQVNLANVEYKENEKNYIKGTTNNYSFATRKVKLNLETSNAPIIIN